MAEQTRRRRLWAPLSRLEQITLAATILIWVGVIVFGVGLYVALAHFKSTQDAYAQATAMASVPTQTPSPTAVMIFPAGWSTATPTPTATPTRPATPALTGSTMAPAAQKAVSPTGTPTAELSSQEPQPTPAADTPQSPSLQPPDRLVIPAIQLDSPVVPVSWQIVEENGYSYSVWEVADDVVGWHKTSALPGQAGNMVLSGHHNIKGEIFRYLVELEPGERVLVYAGDQVYHYVVAEKHILKEKGESPEVRRQNARWIAPTPDERLTLVTCWPYTTNTHRLVVVARPAEPPDAEGLEK
jgi:sortase A